MTFLRFFYRLIALFLWYIVVAVMTVPFHCMGRRGMRSLVFLTRLWMSGAARIANLKVKVYGRLPESGLVVSNHLSYIDAIAQGAVLNVRWAVRSDVALWPIVGLVVATAGPIWVNRNSKSLVDRSLKEFKTTIQSGLNLLIWPEGTSTNGMDGLRPFKSTVFAAAIDLKLPIHPILIRYSDPRVAWYGDMTFVPHFFKIISLPEMHAEIYVLDHIMPENNTRKEFAKIVHDIMDKEYRRTACMSAMGETPDN